MDNALSGAGNFGLQRRAAARIIEELVARVRTWRNTFDACGVTTRDSDVVENAFQRASNIGLREIERAAQAGA